MATAVKISKIVNVLPTIKHTATLFVFHGSGDSGDNIKTWIDALNREELKFPHIKIVYPVAPLQPYTPMAGMSSNVWFDRRDISIYAPECKESIDTMCKLTSELIDNEVQKLGIPFQRIMVSGFSMGGALAMYLAYRYRTSLAGCVAMSSFLNENSQVYQDLQKSLDKNEKLPPLLQFHGLRDSLVPFSWGQETHDALKRLNVNANLIPLPKADHELVKSELEKFKQHILQILPDTH